jgi:hypothetical protein
MFASPHPCTISPHDTIYCLDKKRLAEEAMPRHDDHHTPDDADMAITIVFVIVMVSVLLFLAGATRPYMPERMWTHTDLSLPVVPPM